MPTVATAKRLRVVRLLPVLDFGGVESRAVLWSELVDRERYDVRVCTLDRAGRAAEEIRARGVPVDCLDTPPAIRAPQTTLALARYLRATRPDVLHASVSEAMWHGALAGFATRVPRVLVEETGVPTISLHGALLFRLALRTTDAAIGVSEATCGYLRDVIGADPRRVHRIPNCAAPAFFAPLARVPGSGGLRILTIGRLHPVKNFDGLLRALARVVALAPDTHLTIVGEGPERARLEGLIAALGLGASVTLHGYDRDVRRLHARADLFILPSHTEGQSVALIEAMASGLVVRASARGGNPEVLEGLGAELLFDPADEGAIARAILEVHRMTPAAREAEGARAAARAGAGFSPARYMADLDRFYRGEASSAR